MTYFLQHRPRGLVGDPDHLAQPQRRDAVREQEQLQRLKPLHQGEMRSFKNRADQRRCLMLALSAL
ncbi:hypothetical protein BK140_27235, partial [Paenibacillus macerans]